MLGTLIKKILIFILDTYLGRRFISREKKFKNFQNNFIYLFIFCKLFENKMNLEIISPSQKLKWEHKLNASDEVFIIHNSSIGKVMFPSISRDGSCAF